MESFRGSNGTVVDVNSDFSGTAHILGPGNFPIGQIPASDLQEFAAWVLQRLFQEEMRLRMHDAILEDMKGRIAKAMIGGIVQVVLPLAAADNLSQKVDALIKVDDGYDAIAEANQAYKKARAALELEGAQPSSDKDGR